MRGTVAKRLRRSVNCPSPNNQFVTVNVRDKKFAVPGQINFTDDGFIEPLHVFYRTATFERAVHTPRRQYQMTKEAYRVGAL